MRNLFLCLLLCLLAGKAKVCFCQKLPIKAARTISFTTHEGSFMDVDVSPDGKTIVLALLGDLYTLPISGGTATQITHGLAVNRYPIWSPDGKQIACVSDISGDDRVNIMNADGTGAYTLDATRRQYFIGDLRPHQPVWSPDGRYLAWEDWLLPTAGGTVNLPQEIENVIGFSADGKLLYNFDYGSTVQSYDSATGKIANFIKVPGGSIQCPKLSPDGKWLTYFRMVSSKDYSVRTDLFALDISTGKTKLLVQGVKHHGDVWKASYSFTPDSKYVVLGYSGKIHKVELQTGIDKVIPFSATVKVDMGAFDYNTFKLNEDSLQVKYTRSANASPDGKHLVFSALNRIYVMDLPNGPKDSFGSKPHILVNQPFSQYQPMYSPDGKWIAYATRSELKGGAIWRIPAAGGKPEQLTHDQKATLYTQPTWSPDGKQLAAFRDTGDFDDALGNNRGAIAIISLVDGSIKKIADTIPAINHLAFSADGNRIEFNNKKDFYSNNKRYFNLAYSIKTDGSDRQPIAMCPDPDMINDRASAPGPGLRINDVAFSPGHRFVVYEISQALFLSPVPPLAGPTTLNSKSGALPVIRFASAGVDAHWENGGKILAWSYGNKYYRIDPDKIIAAGIREAKDSTNLATIAVYKIEPKPDEIITINIKVPSNYGHGVIALRNARIITMKDDEVIENGTVLISNGRISVVGTNKDVHIPRNTKVIDLTGKTIMPGLIDVHDHLDGDEMPDIHQQQFSMYLANLAYGITTARDPSSTFSSFGNAELLQTGQMLGPRLFTVGLPVDDSLDSYADALETVQKRKVMGAVTIKQYMQPIRLQREWLLQASQNEGLNMTNEGADDWYGVLGMIKDGSTGVEHAKEWALDNVYSDITQLLAASGTWHTPTLMVEPAVSNAEPYFENLYLQNPDTKLQHFMATDSYQRLIKQKPVPPDSANHDFVYASQTEAAIRHAGTKVTVGGHGGPTAGIRTHWELWAMQMGGLTNMEALQAATIDGAAALGMQQDLGSIEPGKIADLIILDKNPLDDIHNTTAIKYVMKDGMLYDGDTLNTLWPVKKKLPDWRYIPKSTK